MSSQPQWSPGKVAVRPHLDRNMPRGGEEMLDENLPSQDQLKCNEPVMPPGDASQEDDFGEVMLY